MRHNVLVENPHPQSYASYILLKKDYSLFEMRVWLKFRKHVLKSRELTCVYCGKKNLKMSTPRGRELGSLATLDHVMPISKGGAKYDPKNLVVACHTCNNRKGDKI